MARVVMNRVPGCANHPEAKTRIKQVPRDHFHAYCTECEGFLGGTMPGPGHPDLETPDPAHQEGDDG